MKINLSSSGYFQEYRMMYYYAVQDNMLLSLWSVDHSMAELKACGSEEPVDFWHKCDTPNCAGEFYYMYLP